MIEIIPNFHPAAVHFPIALVGTSLLFHVAAALFPNSRWSSQWVSAGHWLLWLGALSAIVAALLGWQAFNSVKHDDASHAAMLVHRNWAISTTVALLLLAAWDIRAGAMRALPWHRLAALVLAFLLVAVTAWHGAELVYRHGLGVMSLPQSEGPGHDHGHGDDHAHGHGDMPMQGEGTAQADGHADSHGEGASDEHPHDADAEPDHKTPSAGGAGTAPKKKEHAHAPGTPPHKD